MSDPSAAAGRAARLLHSALKCEGLGDGEGALRDAVAAHADFREAGDRTGMAAALQLQAVLHANHGDHGRALAALDEAVEHRIATGDAEGVVALHQERFALAVRTGRRDLAREASEAMLAGFERGGDRDGQAQSIHQLVQFLLQAEAHDEAEELLARGLWNTDRAGEERARSALVLLQAQLDQATGHPQRALRRAQEGVRLAELARHRPALVEAWHQLGVLQVGLGQLEEGLATLEQALDGRELLQDLSGRAATLAELARAEQALGRAGEAARHLAYAAQTFEELGLEQARAAALGEAAGLAASVGRFDRALAHGEALVAACAALGAVEAVGQALFSNGQWRIQVGDLAGAERDFERAASELRAAGSAEGHAIVLGMWGQVLDATGERGRALEVLGEAERILTELGSPALAELAPILAEIRSAEA